MSRPVNKLPDLHLGPTDDAPSPMASVPLGPQPGNAACCESCRIVAEAVAILAYGTGYPLTGDRIKALLEVAHDDTNTEAPTLHRNDSRRLDWLWRHRHFHDDAINTETVNQ